MSRFSAIDLSQLPAPQLIDTLAYEAILAALMEDVNSRFQAAGVAYDVGGLETDPVRIILEVAAYRN
jgi:phage-related baseplate assembly protein